MPDNGPSVDDLIEAARSVYAIGSLMPRAGETFVVAHDADGAPIMATTAGHHFDPDTGAAVLDLRIDLTLTQAAALLGG